MLCKGNSGERGQSGGAHQDCRQNDEPPGSGKNTYMLSGAKLLYEFVCHSLSHLHTFFISLISFKITVIELSLSNNKFVYALYASV